LLARDGHVVVPLPAAAVARADELRAIVPALVRRRDLIVSDGISWGSRGSDDPRGAKVHVQLDVGRARGLATDDAAPALLRAVAHRLAAFGAAAERLVGDVGVPLGASIRADVDERGGGVPAHVEDAALTVVFTSCPAELLVGAASGGGPLRPVAGEGWHAVVLPGARAAAILGGLAPTVHAATPPAGRRLSVTWSGRPIGRALPVQGRPRRVARRGWTSSWHWNERAGTRCATAAVATSTAAR
jgi:hypothetical protein